MGNQSLTIEFAKRQGAIVSLLKEVSQLRTDKASFMEFANYLVSLSDRAAELWGDIEMLGWPELGNNGGH